MVYLIGGMAGMRKSSIITPCFCAQKPVFSTSTDLIRASTSQLLEYMRLDRRQAIKLPYLEGEDAPAWIGTIGLIRLLNQNQHDLLVEGVAIRPKGVKDLEIGDPTLKIRAAFVGYSKTMEFQPSEWTPELEKLVEEEIGKEYIELWKKFNWTYQDMQPYDGTEESEKICNAVKELNSPNFKYFDLVNSIPSERRDGAKAKLQLGDYIRNALEIRSFLLG
jgi:hypothetical protein